MCAKYQEWDQYYRGYPLEELGWELGRPRQLLVEFNEKGLLPKGTALDTCCGAGTNTVYLAKKGFEVTAIDISQTAIKIAKEKTKQANASINFSLQSFVDLAFADEKFDFVFDMGCFHHVHSDDRSRFIEGIHRVLKKSGVYMLTCFSIKNGPAWNHFTKQQIISLFSGSFKIELILDVSSLEGDGIVRYFYTALMRRKEFSI